MIRTLELRSLVVYVSTHKHVERVVSHEIFIVEICCITIYTLRGQCVLHAHTACIIKSCRSVFYRLRFNLTAG